MATRFTRTAQNTLEVLFPTLCRACGMIVEGGSWAPFLCSACGERFPALDATVPAPQPLVAAHALAEFTGPARRLLLDLKFGGVTRIGGFVGGRMAEAPGASSVLDGANAIVPIPLHWSRRWYRGHNQSLLLARGLCRRSSRLALVRALRRCRATPAQMSLGREQRRGNVAGAFRARLPAARELRRATVVLIDDVVTTGSTAAEAASALLDAGAAEVRLYAATWACDQSIQRKPVGAGDGSNGLIGSPGASV